jgi:GNAT superfamily N-acetyltransferase
MNYRPATLHDIAVLAAMNKQLIEGEGHRNRMSVSQLEDRMKAWLQDEYQSVLFEDQCATLGYALFKSEPEWWYLRQFFVVASRRRQGIGRGAMHWLFENVWNDGKRIRLDVLVGNSAGIPFWRSLGFLDYCLTMEREPVNRLQY